MIELIPEGGVHGLSMGWGAHKHPCGLEARPFQQQKQQHVEVRAVAGPAPVLPGAAAVDNTDLKHTVVAVGGTVAGVSFKGVYGKASGTYAGGAVNGKQYAASVSYTMDAITGTAFYTDDSALLGTVAYGIGASYDLGGGASIVGGVAKTKVSGPDATAFDLGVSLKF